MNNQTILLLIILVVAVGAVAIIGLVLLMVGSGAPPASPMVNNAQLIPPPASNTPVPPVNVPVPPSNEIAADGDDGATPSVGEDGRTAGNDTGTGEEPFVVKLNEVFGVVAGEQRDTVLDAGYVLVELFYLQDTSADVDQATRQIMGVLHDIAGQTKEILIVSKIEAMAAYDYFRGSGAGVVPAVRILAKGSQATILRGYDLIAPLSDGTLTNVIMLDVCGKTWRCDIVDGKMKKNV